MAEQTARARNPGNLYAAPDDDRDGIDLTPMLDVVFIMLIFFIVTATFVREQGISVDRPEASTPPTEATVAILVTIDSDSRFWIEQRLIDPRVLRANLERLGAEAPDAPVVIRADPASHNDALVSALDSARAAGIYNISLAENQTMN